MHLWNVESIHVNTTAVSRLILTDRCPRLLPCPATHPNPSTPHTVIPSKCHPKFHLATSNRRTWWPSTKHRLIPTSLSKDIDLQVNFNLDFVVYERKPCRLVAFIWRALRWSSVIIFGRQYNIIDYIINIKRCVGRQYSYYIPSVLCELTPNLRTCGVTWSWSFQRSAFIYGKYNCFFGMFLSRIFYNASCVVCSNINLLLNAAPLLNCIITTKKFMLISHSTLLRCRCRSDGPSTLARGASAPRAVPDPILCDQRRIPLPPHQHCCSACAALSELAPAIHVITASGRRRCFTRSVSGGLFWLIAILTLKMARKSTVLAISTAIAFSSASQSPQDSSRPPSVHPEAAPTPPPKKKGRSGHSTGYILFASHCHPRVRAEHPDMAFGEISKIVSVLRSIRCSYAVISYWRAAVPLGTILQYL